MERHSIMLKEKDLTGILIPPAYRLPSIILDGAVLSDKDIITLEAKIRLFPWRTLYSNLMLPMQTDGKDTKQSKENLHHMLEQYGLLEYQHSYPFLLSPAMQHRAALVQALLQKPALVCFSCTFDNLDASDQIRIIRDIRQILKNEGQTALFLTRQIPLSLLFSDQILLPGPSPTLFPVDRRNEADLMRNNYNSIWNTIMEHR